MIQPGDFFYFVYFFGNKLKLCDFVNLWVVEDRIQDLDKCHLWYFSNIFFRQLVQSKQEQQNTKQETIKPENNRNFT